MSRHTELLKRYLADPADVDVTDYGYPFVTISRQAGAGGHTLAREIIRKLDQRADAGWNRGWELFDQKLCAYLAQDPSTQASFESLLKEEYHHGVQQSVFEMLTGKAETYQLQKKIADVVRFLAWVGRVVIVGRAGMCVARKFPVGVHVRLVAPEAVRAERLANEWQKDLGSTLVELRRQDQERARMVRDMYGRQIDDPLLYTVVFNTEERQTEGIASAVVELVAQRRAQNAKPFRSPFGDE